jgi:putative ABC transport system permease protein
VKFLPLVLANFRRHKLRLVLTLLSIAAAFLLFSYLAAIRQAFTLGVDVAGADRLVVRHKVSIIQLLPQSYEARIERMPGVEEALHQTWFGGIYKEAKNFFPQVPVRPEELLSMYPEFLLPEEQKQAWMRTRTGAIVGRKTAERFGFKVGDRIPIQATIWPPKSGGQMWEFDLVGIYDGKEKGTDTTQFLFRHDYFDENRRWGEGMVGWYVIRVNDPDQAVEISKKIDEEFANSPAETKTETEGAFVKAFADQVGDIGAIVTAILTAVFFTILLVAGNTMAQAVRERTQELGVLKAVGFSDWQVLTFVLTESVLLAIIGGGIGLGIGWVMVSQGDPTDGALPIFFIPRAQLILGIVFVFLLGIVAGILPALQAMRLRTVEALRKE